MADAYARFAIEFEADLSRVQASMSQGLSWANQYGQGMSQGFSGGFLDGLRQVEGGVNMLTSLRGRFANTAQGLSEIFGMQAGADMAYFRRQLTGMVGDAGQAEKTLASLIRIANTTNFGNADIMQMASSALGSGTSAQNLEGEISNLLDASAAMGVRDMGTFRRMSRNFFDLRGKPGEANQRDVNELYRAAPQFVFQAAKVMGTSAQGAREQIQSMSGGDLYDLIVKIGESNKGKAQAEGMADPFVAAANAADQLNTALAPTGELLNRTLTPLVGGGAALGGLFANINKAGAGIPGLVLGLGTLGGGILLYNATIGRTTFALNVLAGATLRAAAAQGGAGAVNAAAGASGGLGRFAGGAMGVGAGAATSIPVLWPVVASVVAMLGGATAAKFAQNQSNSSDNKTTSAAWTALRATVGLLPNPVGMGANLYNTASTQGKAETPLDKAAEKLTRAAEKLSDASATGYGYGVRGQQVLSSVEAGYALLGSERLGVA